MRDSLKIRYFDLMRFLLLYLVVLTSAAYGQAKWANKVLAVSSNFSVDTYKPEEVLGKPNVFPNHIVNGCSWAPAANDLTPFISLGFEQAIQVRQIAVFINSGANTFSGAQAILKDGTFVDINTDQVFPISDSKKVLRVFLENPIQEAIGIKLRFNTSFSKKLLQVDAIGVSDLEKLIEPELALANYFRPFLISQLNNPNTRCDELSPVYDPLNNQLIFTRKNCVTNAEGANPASGDLYFSSISGGAWLAAKPLSPRLNTYDNNEVYGLSADGQRLYFSGKTQIDGDKKFKSILVSTRKNEVEWSEPVPVFVQDLYSYDERENTVWMSPDESFILMSLVRKDSYGKTDLYISLRQPNGQYSAPMHMGANINSAGFEFSPYLSKDLKTLYFASYGFAGYGGSDLYVSKRLGSSWTSWTEPENLGPKINSEFFEGYFRWLSEPDTFIFTSTRTDKTAYGDFFIGVSPEKEVVECMPFPSSLIPDSLKTYPQTIVWQNKNDGRFPIKLKIRSGLFQLTEVELYDSTFSIAYASGHKLQFEMEHPYFGVYRDSLITSTPEIKQINLKWSLPGQSTVLENLLFEYNQDVLLPGNEAKLDFLVEWLKQYPNLRISIHGHTEPGGNTLYNKRLSSKRAERVRGYLVKNGISNDRVEVIGHGGTQPIYTGDQPEIRQKNRRVEFSILP